MLTLYFGLDCRPVRYGDERFVDNSEDHFDFLNEDWWFEDDFVKYVIKEIDKSVVLGGTDISSPVLGRISPLQLSHGCKTVILLKMLPEYIYDGDCVGDNCWKYIFELAETQDIELPVTHCLDYDQLPDNVKCRCIDPFNKITMVDGPNIRLLDAWLEAKCLYPAAIEEIYKNEVEGKWTPQYPV